MLNIINTELAHSTGLVFHNECKPSHVDMLQMPCFVKEMEKCATGGFAVGTVVLWGCLLT